MSNQTETTTETKEKTLDHWPPEIHIVYGPPVAGERALCGAKIMGIEFPHANPTCKRCIELDYLGE